MKLASTREIDWSDTDISVLYDIFFETGTRLSGLYLHLERQAEQAGDEDAATFWASQQRRILDERQAVYYDSREEIIGAMKSFKREFQLVQGTLRTVEGAQ